VVVAVSSVVISVDAELGWGFHDLDELPVDRVEAGRDGWRYLLDLFDQYQVPATWAVVGHLFLDDCDSVHPGHPTPSDWFTHEREQWQSRRDLRFGGELIDTLVTADVDHDIASHTFSHILFDREWASPEVVQAELDAAIEAGQQFDIDYDSFVYPRNIVGHRELLAENDFVAYRGSMPSGAGWAFSRLASLVDSEQTRLVEPYVDEYGLVDVPPSLYLFDIKGKARTVIETAADPIVRITTNGIDRAIREGGVFHLWLHPNDLQTARDVDRIRRILEYIDQRRDSGLTVETMADVASRVSP